MKIFVVGSGKLAKAILKANLSFPSCEILQWETHFQTLTEKAIIVHAGSGRQLTECFTFCDRTKSLFIELSTGLSTEALVPDFPLIICPNTSILVLKTLNCLKQNGKYFENYSVSITESHQSTKKTEPGTAYAFANALRFPVGNIVSVRDPGIQENEIGIPTEYLDKHAYHKVVISDGDDEITIETKVMGHSAYAKGVKAIIDMVLTYPLDNKKYTILDFIEGGMI